MYQNISRLLCLAFLSMSSVSFGEIREIKLMSEAVAEVDEAVLSELDRHI